MIIAVIAIFWLPGTKLDEPTITSKPSSFADYFRLLGKPVA